MSASGFSDYVQGRAEALRIHDDGSLTLEELITGAEDRLEELLDAEDLEGAEFYAGMGAQAFVLNRQRTPAAERYTRAPYEYTVVELGEPEETVEFWGPRGATAEHSSAFIRGLERGRVMRVLVRPSYFEELGFMFLTLGLGDAESETERGEQ
jgi:hypothetical protein